MAGGIRQAVGRKCPSRTELVRVGDHVQLARWRVSGRRAPSGWEWQGAQSRQGATELGFPRPTLWQMQSEAARRAGEPSGDREEAPPEGLGGHQLLAQTDASCPASEVMRHHLHRQPGSVGGDGRPPVPGLPVQVGDAGVMAVSGEEGQLGTGRGLYPPDDEPHRRGVGLTLDRGAGRGCRWPPPQRRCRPSSKGWASSPSRVSPR